MTNHDIATHDLATPDTIASPVSPLRVSVTLPGSASLGAFQAGAVAALSVVIRSLRARGQPVAIDAIGGASAGSIVAALFAHCLVSGRDAPGRALRPAFRG